MSFPTGSALAPSHILMPSISWAWIFNSPIIENHAFHPFWHITATESLRWLMMATCTAVLLFSVVPKMCKETAHERELQSFLLQSPQPYLHIGGICFDLANCPELKQTSAKTHPQYVSIPTVHKSCALAVMRTLQGFSLCHHNGK